MSEWDVHIELVYLPINEVLSSYFVSVCSKLVKAPVNRCYEWVYLFTGLD